MASQLSPGIQIIEQDFTSIVPAVATSAGAFAGVFAWGPVMEPTQITSENQLVARFGKPFTGNASSFFTAANFLSYTNNLLVARVDTSGARNAVASTNGSISVINAGFGATGLSGYGYTTAPTVTISAPNETDGTQASATATIADGVITSINGIVAGSGYKSAPIVTITGDGVGAAATAVVNYTSGATGLASIIVTNGGSGYSYATVSFKGGAGNGAGATGVAIRNGVVTKVAVDNPGFGYNTSTITLTAAPSVVLTVASSGFGATGPVITSVGHGLINGDQVKYLKGSGSEATPLVDNTVYYVVNKTTDTFQLSSTFGGSAITLTANGTSNQTFTKQVQTATTYGTLTTAGLKINNKTAYEAAYEAGQSITGPWAAKYPGSAGNSLKVSIADSSNYATWAYAAEFDGAPDTSDYAATLEGSNDELHIVVVDEDGVWSGTKGTILEKYPFVSKASNARKADGTNNYYKDVINTRSSYVWWTDHPVTTWGVAAANTAFANVTTANWSLTGGTDDLTATDGQLIDGFSLFSNTELYDISLLPTGQVSPTVAKYVVENVAETRQDCVAFVSPVSTSGEVIQGIDAVNETIAFRTNSSFNVNSSYGLLDSGFKYQYDRYNDVYRWVPLNGDMAGLCARTDYTNDPWWSPGGLTRGQVKNVVKLSLNPNQVQRDELYKKGINPVVAFPGQGTILYGDKTLLSKPSAFDRINVRRLFITLEKAIALASKAQMFEFNDEFTRSQFKAMVEPYLRDVQGRRGITDFRVKCDSSNNTADVVDRNEFVASIFVKPARSINFITLTFVAARTGISFSEIGA